MPRLNQLPQEEKPNRQFKGVWIPKEIWLEHNLSWFEKLFFTEISSLSSNTKGCFASNKYFSEFFHMSPSRISHIVQNLIKKRYITAEYVRNGGEITQRVLRICNRGGIAETQGGYCGNSQGINTVVLNNTKNLKPLHGKKTALPKKDSQSLKTSSALAPKVKAGAKIKYPNSKAVILLCSMTETHAYLTEQKMEIDETVPNSIEARKKWEEVIRAWLLVGFNTMNTHGMVGWYKNGINLYNNAGYGRQKKSDGFHWNELPVIPGRGN